MQQSHVLSKCKRHYFEVTLELELRSVLLRQTTSVIFSGKFCCQIKYRKDKEWGKKLLVKERSLFSGIQIIS